MTSSCSSCSLLDFFFFFFFFFPSLCWFLWPSSSEPEDEPEGKGGVEIFFFFFGALFTGLPPPSFTSTCKVKSRARSEATRRGVSVLNRTLFGSSLPSYAPPSPHLPEHFLPSLPPISPSPPLPPSFPRFAPINDPSRRFTRHRPIPLPLPLEWANEFCWYILIATT